MSQIFPTVTNTLLICRNTVMVPKYTSPIALKRPWIIPRLSLSYLCHMVILSLFSISYL